MRGSFYDNQGLSYLFDMNDLAEREKRDEKIQLAYNNEFFPLCIDAMFYGNEARFINHSCDANIQSFNLCGQVESQTLHQIGLFASKFIKAGDEITLDYQWDKSELDIQNDVPCLCLKEACRGFLMRSKPLAPQ